MSALHVEIDMIQTLAKLEYCGILKIKRLQRKLNDEFLNVHTQMMGKIWWLQMHTHAR